MESRVKLLGHPVHPMLIVFPLGLLSTATLFDALHLARRNTVFSTVAFWNVTAGVVGGLAAATFGAWDWWHIPHDTRAKRIGLWHGVGNVVVTALFAASWMRRRRTVEHVPDTLAYGLSFTGAGLAAITSWLGGELVDRLGVGVDAGANLNAPNSLSGEPASATSLAASDTAARLG